MDRPTPILLVTGPPASGKSFMANLLADRLGLPLIEKDAIKETLFDTLGSGDSDRSHQLGRATTELLYRALEVQLRARRPVIVEANLARDDARPRLRSLGKRHSFAPLEIHCTAAEDVLLARFAARAGSRHPGHLDSERMPEIAAAIASGRYRPVSVGSEGLIVIDTTSFDDLDLDSLVHAARDHLALAAGHASPR